MGATCFRNFGSHGFIGHPQQHRENRMSRYLNPLTAPSCHQDRGGNNKFHRLSQGQEANGLTDQHWLRQCIMGVAVKKTSNTVPSANAYESTSKSFMRKQHTNFSASAVRIEHFFLQNFFTK